VVEKMFLLSTLDDLHSKLVFIYVLLIGNILYTLLIEILLDTIFDYD
jgi:hypothetical protein